MEGQQGDEQRQVLSSTQWDPRPSAIPPPIFCLLTDLDGEGEQGSGPRALVQEGHGGRRELRLSVDDIGLDSGKDAVIHQEQGTLLQEKREP